MMAGNNSISGLLDAPFIAENFIFEGICPED
jgi:hypothetical protein